MFIHRLLIGKDKNKNKEIIYFTVLMQIICSLFAIIVAAVALSKYQGMEGNSVFFKTIGDVIQNNFFHALFSIAMLAVILSSADSLINTGAIIFVENVIKDKIKNSSSKLRMAKIVTVISGFLGLFIALKSTSLLSIIFFFAQCYSATLLIPFVGGLFIKNADSHIFWVSSITGFISYTLLKILAPEIEHTAYVISLFMSFIAFILTIYLVKKNIINHEKYLVKLENITENIIKQMNIPVSKLGYAIIPVSFFTTFTQIISDGIIINTIVFMVAAGIIGLSFIFIDTIFEHQKRILRNCYVLFAIWYCFPFLSAYLYYTLPNSNVAFANMVISCTLLAVIFSSKVLCIFMTIGALLGSLVFVILRPVEFGVFISHATILASIVLYIGIISYFILRTKEAGIKKIISEVIKETSGGGSNKSSIILNQYLKVIEVVKKHEKAKELFLEKRSEFKGYEESNDIIAINIEELVEILRDYLSLIELEKGIKFEIQNTIKDITINRPISTIYTIVFSIAYQMIGFNEKINKISITNKNNQIVIKYNLPNLELNISEIKRYVRGSNNPEEIISFSLIERIISEQKNMEIKTSKNSITLTIISVTKSTRGEDIEYINLLSSESKTPKVFN